MSDNNLPPTGPPPSISKPSYDPGWNDPPTFHYANNPPVTKTKLNLNKRVAFPMQSTTSDSGLNIAATTKVKTSASGLPLPFAKVQQQPPPPPLPSIAMVPTEPKQPLSLPPAGGPPLAKPLIPSSITDSNNSDSLLIETISDEEKHSKIMNIFTLVLKTNNLETAKYNEIEKRLNVLSSMWLEERFDNNLKTKLWDIAQALENEKLSEAMNLYRSLAVDYGSVSAQWSIALRQLIIIKQQQSETLLDGLADTNCQTDDEPTIITPTPAIDLLLDTSTIVKGRIQHL